MTATGWNEALTDLDDDAPESFGNALLDSLADRDRALLAPYLERVTLQREQMLADAGDILAYAVFPEGPTAVSLFATTGDGRIAEVGMVGRSTGACGLVAMGGKGHLPWRAMVILSGPARRIPTAQLCAIARRSAGVRAMLARQRELALAHVAQVATCNALHPVEQRICRWLLTAHDCARGGADPEITPLPLTQEQVGDALGVQRTTITVIAMRLQQAKLVRYARGKLFVLNRPGLEETSCECHRALGQVRKRLLAEAVEA